MSRYKLAIFDFDGTLCDSFPWFLRVVNEVAGRHGFRRIEDHEVERLRGLDPRALLRHLDVPFWKLPAIARDMRAMKTRELPGIPLFGGARDMLARLSRSGIVTAIVSSDSAANIRAALGADAQQIAHFACGASLFGKAAKFRRVLKESGIAAGATIAIGDEIRDHEAARRAGIAFGAVAWGYAAEGALKALSPDEFFVTMDNIGDTLAGPG